MNRWYKYTTCEGRCQERVEKSFATSSRASCAGVELPPPGVPSGILSPASSLWRPPPGRATSAGRASAAFAAGSCAPGLRPADRPEPYAKRCSFRRPLSGVLSPASSLWRPPPRPGDVRRKSIRRLCRGFLRSRITPCRSARALCQAVFLPASSLRRPLSGVLSLASPPPAGRRPPEEHPPPPVIAPPPVPQSRPAPACAPRLPAGRS